MLRFVCNQRKWGCIMAKVTFGLSQHALGREEKALVFVATNPKGGKLGELHVSSGGLRWYPKGSKKSHHFATWQALDNLFTGNIKKST